MTTNPSKTDVMSLVLSVVLRLESEDRLTYENFRREMNVDKSYATVLMSRLRRSGRWNGKMKLKRGAAGTEYVPTRDEIASEAYKIRLENDKSIAEPSSRDYQVKVYRVSRYR